MIYWAQLLHFYQPPVQSLEVLRRVAEESYRPLLDVFEGHPAARLAVNMNGVLTEMLVEHGLGDVVERLAALAERGQVEFTGSGMYHPILPLIPRSECERSIQENAAANRRRFGTAWRARGFFPPEMAYGPAIDEPVAAAGHDWMLLSGVACPEEWARDSVYRLRTSRRELSVLFRDDGASNAISFRQTDPERFVAALQRTAPDGTDAYVVTAMDAETFGHHIKGWERDFLAATFDLVGREDRARPPRQQMAMATPSELVELFPAGPHLEPHPSSWSTSRDDIAAMCPYPLWKSPGNATHRAQWEYVQHCLDVVAIARRYGDDGEAKRYAAMADERLQPGLHSCQFWMWQPSLVLRGLLLLNEALVYGCRSVQHGSAPERTKLEVRWRLAAANSARAELERQLITESPE